MFCSKCHMRIIRFFEKDGKKFSECVKGHVIEREKSEPPLIIKKKRKQKRFDGNDFIATEESIKNAKKDQSIITSIPCPFCGVRECLYLRLYRFSADEGEVFFMKCLGCGRNFREGSGDGSAGGR